MPILQNTADPSFIPPNGKKKNILMTVLQEVTTVALRIKDQVCCLEPVRTSYCTSMFEDCFTDITVSVGEGRGMRLKIIWIDSSSWPLPSAEAKLSD